jgi:hypothetical protein
VAVSVSAATRPVTASSGRIDRMEELPLNT